MHGLTAFKMLEYTHFPLNLQCMGAFGIQCLCFWSDSYSQIIIKLLTQTVKAFTELKVYLNI